MRLRSARATGFLVLVVGVLQFVPVTARATADPNVDLVAVVSSGASPFYDGQVDNLQITVRNVGTATATGDVSLSMRSIEYVPGAASGMGPLPLSSAGAGWVCTGGSVCTTSGTIGPGEELPPLTVGLTIDRNVRSINTIVSLGASSDGNTLNDWVQFSTPVVQSPEPALIATLAANPSRFTSDEQGSYVVTVQNAGATATPGPITAAVAPREYLLCTVSFCVYDIPVTGSGVGWSCNANQCVYQAGLAPGESTSTLTYTFLLYGPTVGQGSLDPTGFVTAFVSATDAANSRWLGANVVTPVSANATEFPVAVDVVSSLVPDAGFVTTGQPTGFGVVVENTGTAAATNATTVTLDTSVGLSGSGDGWLCTSSTCTNGNPIPPGGRLPALRFTGSIPGLFDLMQFRANVQTSNADDTETINNMLGNCGNNICGSNVYLPVNSAAELVPIIQPDVPTFLANQSGSWNIIIKNVGVSAYTSPVSVQIYNGPNLTITGSGWRCDSTFLCAHPAPVPAGGSLPPITVSTTPTVSGLFQAAAAIADARYSSPGGYVDSWFAVSATLAHVLRYVALGDSVAYGTGLVNPTKGTLDGLSPNAGPSIMAWPDFVAEGLPGLRPLAYRPQSCNLGGSPGGVYDQLAYDGAPSIANAYTGKDDNCIYPKGAKVPVHKAVYPQEIAAAALGSAQPALVTLQAGADDIKFGGCLADLLNVPSWLKIAGAYKCTNRDKKGELHATTQLAQELASLRDGLSASIAAIHHTAPNAQIVLVNYYQIIPIPTDGLFGSSTLCLALRHENLAKRSDVFDVAGFVQQQLNDTIQSAAFLYSDVKLVDIASLFAGHEMCTADPWLFDGGITDNFFRAAHPNLSGQAQIGHAVVAYCRSQPRECVGR